MLAETQPHRYIFSWPKLIGYTIATPPQELSHFDDDISITRFHLDQICSILHFLNKVVIDKLYDCLWKSFNYFYINWWTKTEYLYLLNISEDVKALSLPGTYHEKVVEFGSSFRKFTRLKSLDVSRNTITCLKVKPFIDIIFVCCSLTDSLKVHYPW